MGKNPLCFLTQMVSGDVGIVMHVCQRIAERITNSLEFVLCIFPLCMGELLLVWCFYKVHY